MPKGETMVNKIVSSKVFYLLVFVVVSGWGICHGAVDVVTEPYLLDTGLVSRSISFENPTGAPGEGGKAASNGRIENVYIKGASVGFIAEGRHPDALNANYVLQKFIVRDFADTGIHVRGKNVRIRNGCSYNPTTNAALNRQVRLDTANASTHDLENIDKTGTLCPARSSTGSVYN